MRLARIDLPAVGEERYLLREEAELKFGSEKVALKVLFLWPELPLLEPIASENIGAFKGELSNALGYWKSDVLEEESERTSPPEVGRWRLSWSSTFGSMRSRERSSHPLLALYDASARVL